MANRSVFQRNVTRRIIRPLEAVLLYAIHLLLKALPLETASGLAGAVARTVGPRLGLSRRARKNIRRVFPDLDKAGVEKLVVEMWDNLGRLAGELPHVPQIKVFDSDPQPGPTRVEIVGIEHVDAARDSGKPVIFYTAHIGNWEIAPLAARQRGLPLHVIYRSSNNRWADLVFLSGRREVVRGLIPKGSEGAREIVKVISEGGALGLLLDQKMNDGIPVPFFGTDVMTAPATAQLALRHDCLIVPAWVERKGGTYFKVVVEPPMVLPRTSDRHADILAIMTAINRQIEKWILARPGQWLWLHRRWPD